GGVGRLVRKPRGYPALCQIARYPTCARPYKPAGTPSVLFRAEGSRSTWILSPWPVSNLERLSIGMDRARRSLQALPRLLAEHCARFSLGTQSNWPFSFVLGELFVLFNDRSWVRDMNRKIEAARRQLGTALALYLKDSDPVSVLCLAGGGCEVIEHFAKKAGGKPFASHMLETHPHLDSAKLHQIQRQY